MPRCSLPFSSWNRGPGRLKTLSLGKNWARQRFCPMSSRTSLAPRRGAPQINEPLFSPGSRMGWRWTSSSCRSRCCRCADWRSKRTLAPTTPATCIWLGCSGCRSSRLTNAWPEVLGLSEFSSPAYESAMCAPSDTRTVAEPTVERLPEGLSSRRLRRRHSVKRSATTGAY